MLSHNMCFGPAVAGRVKRWLNINENQGDANEGRGERISLCASSGKENIKQIVRRS